jgi:protein SCO1/2
MQEVGSHVSVTCRRRAGGGNQWSRLAERVHRAAGRTALVVALVALAGCGGVDAANRAAADESAPELRGRMLAEPIAKPDFTLTDTDGRAFDFRRETEGRLTLLFFGYTNCPDVCPVHMQNLGAVLAPYPYEMRQRIRVVFVTTDPERDTPERLRAWLDAIDPSFIGLSGPVDDVNRIQALVNLPAAVRDVEREDGAYLVGHAAQVLAFTPDGFGRVAYPFGTRQEDWVRDLPRLLEQDWN